MSFDIYGRSRAEQIVGYRAALHDLLEAVRFARSCAAELSADDGRLEAIEGDVRVLQEQAAGGVEVSAERRRYQDRRGSDIFRGRR